MATLQTAARETWQVPAYQTHEFHARRTRYCIGIPIINEGERIRRQLTSMTALAPLADIIIGDGGSRDGTADPAFMRQFPIRSLLVKTGPGKLSAQLRMLFAYAMDEGYEGVVTVDGNGKDGLDAIPRFISALDEGFDYVQGSRYLPGGGEENTPWDRKWGVYLLHAPLISVAAGFRYTDTTNGFRAFGAKLLNDDRLRIFRDVFDTYNLHYYVSVRAPRLNFRVTEIPVTRRYPAAGPTPSKIGGLKGKTEIITLLLKTVAGRYNP